MDLDTFHEYMQDGRDIQDLSCIQVLELKWKNVHICIQMHTIFEIHYLSIHHLRSAI